MVFTSRANAHTLCNFFTHVLYTHATLQKYRWFLLGAEAEEAVAFRAHSPLLHSLCVSFLTLYKERNRVVGGHCTSFSVCRLSSPSHGLHSFPHPVLLPSYTVTDSEVHIVSIRVLVYHVWFTLHDTLKFVWNVCSQGCVLNRAHYPISVLQRAGGTCGRLHCSSWTHCCCRSNKGTYDVYVQVYGTFTLVIKSTGFHVRRMRTK